MIPLDLEPHRRFLFGLCYRMTGVAADAEDLVQQTFARAIAAPPGDRTTSLKPWLATVATNWARDHLRARRRRGYVGPFLPSPVPTGAVEDEAIAHEPDAHEDGPPRYELLESVSYAFLIALEALTPTQRAVLLLRDVFDYSVRETAQALALGESNVKVTHHRARLAMQRYDETRALREGGPRAANDVQRAALEAFTLALASGDVTAVEALLREDVRAVNDGGGEFFAARVPVVGRAKVARFYTKIAARGQLVGAAFVELNGAPAILARFAPAEGVAPVVVTRVEVDADGRIAELHSVLAPRKLEHLTTAGS
jgi:RNA polymerase sigma-70 factor (ECF subfamily)